MRTSRSEEDEYAKTVVFRDCLFDNVDFTGCALTDVLFVGCRFISCAMARARLQRVDFRSCQALGLNLAEARLNSVSFDDCQLRYADLTETAVKGLRAGKTSFAEGSWRASTLRDVAFRDCDLTRLELAGTSLAGIDLSTCQIGGFMLSEGLRELRGSVIAPEQAVDLVGHLACASRRTRTVCGATRSAARTHNSSGNLKKSCIWSGLQWVKRLRYQIKRS